MTVKLEGDALQILSGFIRCAEAYPDRMTTAMHYDPDSFTASVEMLKRACEDAKKSRPRSNARRPKQKNII